MKASLDCLHALMNDQNVLINDHFRMAHAQGFHICAGDVYNKGLDSKRTEDGLLLLSSFSWLPSLWSHISECNQITVQHSRVTVVSDIQASEIYNAS